MAVFILALGGGVKRGEEGRKSVTSTFARQAPGATLKEQRAEEHQGKNTGRQDNREWRLEK
jgi:hypothetical protein